MQDAVNTRTESHGEPIVATIAQVVERRHKLIISLLVLVILVMVTSCLFHDIIPICHWLFGCDHQMHVAAAP
jgi:hypothetical protein